jgi:hypothetical protein
MDFANDDPLQFHLDRHESLAFVLVGLANASGWWGGKASLSGIIELYGKMGQACQSRAVALPSSILPEIRKRRDWQINRPDVRLKERLVELPFRAKTR